MFGIGGAGTPNHTKRPRARHMTDEKRNAARIIARATGHGLDIAIIALEAMQNELNRISAAKAAREGRDRLSRRAIHRNAACKKLIQMTGQAEAGETIDWFVVLDHIADIDPAGYEAVLEAICRGEEPPANLAWTLQLVLLAALEEENAIA